MNNTFQRHRQRPDVTDVFGGTHRRSSINVAAEPMTTVFVEFRDPNRQPPSARRTQ
jgi:hypothetical protein